MTIHLQYLIFAIVYHLQKRLMTTEKFEKICLETDMI